VNLRLTRSLYLKSRVRGTSLAAWSAWLGCRSKMGNRGEAPFGDVQHHPASYGGSGRLSCRSELTLPFAGVLVGSLCTLLLLTFSRSNAGLPWRGEGCSIAWPLCPRRPGCSAPLCTSGCYRPHINAARSVPRCTDLSMAPSTATTHTPADRAQAVKVRCRSTPHVRFVAGT
jgi:hypothetical protein